MPMYSYRCGCGNEFDELKPLAERHSCECPECGVTAEQRITPVRLDYYHMGLSPTMPTAADKWAKMHEQRARQETKRELG